MSSQEAEEERQDWRDGHLFVGNQLALDFLNTDLVANGQAVELLPDAASVARWIRNAGLVSESEKKRLEQNWAQSAAAGKSVAALKSYRNRLRAGVFAFEAGSGVSTEFLDELNTLLRTQPVFREVERVGRRGYKQRRIFAPRMPDDLLGVLAEATMELLTGVPAERVRKCEGCPVHFQDISKKGSRRWCSMQLCGNKVKVAAYQRRKRSSTPN